MKLQNLSVIFIVIIIPIILIVSYYISLQVDTINMQTAYNTKLLESTKEAIEAFEINTVEWNDAYSETADSKRRDIMASINTFTTSFSNSIGMGGASKETILAYVPAIAYTLYDGYYIYSPAETKVTIKDDDGVAVFVKQNLVNYGSNSGRPITFSDNKYNADNEGKLLYEYDSEKGGSPDGTYIISKETKEFTLNSAYAKTTYSHILKPFTAYSARYKTGDGLDDTDITVNYTLDNYITIYGTVDRKYQKKSGYLIDTEKIEISERKYEIVKVDGHTIDSETLTEKIWYEGLDLPTEFPYVYEAENNTKVYIDGTTPFQVSSSGVRTNLSDLSSIKYKKLSIYNGDDSCIEIYQALNDSKDGTITKGKWYIKKDSTDEAKDYGQSEITLEKDVSAINYYVESYAFSKWVYAELSNIKVENMQSQTEHITITGKIFDEQGIENEDSIFNLHKREIIKQAVISNLNQAITSYSRNSEGEFSLPVLTETDWDQILDNVSIITFVQGIPIGMKYYNNYSIATSTSNKEYVDPAEIYLSTSEDEYYHLPYCKHLTSTNRLIGYRSIDYKVKSYEEEENAGYYYKHENISNEECYYCLVQRSLFSSEGLSEADKTEHAIAYETALAREKYAARKINVPNIVIADTGELPIEPDPETIEIKNDGDDTINGSITIKKTGTYKIILVAGGGRRE